MSIGGERAAASVWKRARLTMDPTMGLMMSKNLVCLLTKCVSSVVTGGVLQRPSSYRSVKTVGENVSPSEDETALGTTLDFSVIWLSKAGFA